MLDGSSSFSRSSSSPLREPAPRIVPQPENQTAYKPPLIFTLLFSPLTILSRVFSRSLGLLAYLFPLLPRLLSNVSRSSPGSNRRQNTTGRRPLNPRDTAARFSREFEEEYGSHSLRFFEDGYAQAYDLAKKDLNFLLVVLMSPEHDDTSSFVQNTLLSQEVVSYINKPENKILLWAGSVQDSEAYQVANALNCTKFPFAALVVHTPQDSSTSMSTIARITGLIPASAFVARLRAAIAQQSSALDRIRATRAEQQASRNLREEQNTAYERSLAQDRERARRRREEEAARLRVEQEAKAKAEAREREAQKKEQWRRWRAHQLRPEPSREVKDLVRISVRIPSGERILRNFPFNADLEELYAFVECQDLVQQKEEYPEGARPENYEHQYAFQLVSPMPRMVYGLDSGGTVGNRIGRSGNLIVESLMEEESDGDQ